MNNPTIQEQLSIAYNEYVDYLLEKYGKVQGNYFSTPACKTKNKKILRTNEGLNIHHIDENKIIMLGNSNVASSFPFEYQLANRLVYANLLEHLLLHIKIAEEFDKNSKTYGTVGTGGVIMVAQQINDYFGKLPEEPNGWCLNMFNAIRNQYSDYISVLNYIHNSKCDLLSHYSVIKLCSGWNGEIYDKIFNDFCNNMTEDK